MTGSAPGHVLSIVVCGAGPASAIGTFVKLALERGWTVQVIATPTALDFFDQDAIEALTGSPVRSQYSPPGSPRSRIPDAIAVAPATYNTINKWATGASDTYALGVLAEQTGMGKPIVVLPFINAALASRAPFQRNVESLRAEGVQVLLGPGAIEPHQPHTGGALIDSYPWYLALDEADKMTGTSQQERTAKHLPRPFMRTRDSATREPAFQMSPDSIICGTDASGTHSTRAASLRSVGSPTRSGFLPIKAECSASTIPGIGWNVPRCSTSPAR